MKSFKQFLEGKRNKDKAKADGGLLAGQVADQADANRMGGGQANRAQTHKNKKAYNRKDKSWRND